MMVAPFQFMVSTRTTTRRAARASALIRHGRGAALPNRPGFTLIELITSITVGVIIGGVAGLLVWNASKQRAEIAARSELADVAASAMEEMLRYIREIPQGETFGQLNGKAQIDTASATELRFGNTGFRLNAGTLEITANNGTSWYPIARDVSNLAFSYVNRSGAALTSLPLSQSDREAVRRIGIDLTLTRSSQNARLRTSLYLRSFMDEVYTNPS